jgi:hypothetical protein
MSIHAFCCCVKPQQCEKFRFALIPTDILTQSFEVHLILSVFGVTNESFGHFSSSPNDLPEKHFGEWSFLNNSAWLFTPTETKALAKFKALNYITWKADSSSK